MTYRVCFAALLAVLAGGARADGDYPSPTQDRVRVSLGVQSVGASTQFQLDSGSNAPGTLINGEDTLGLDRRRTEPRFAVEVRAGDRNRVRLDYFSLNRSDLHVLTTGPLDYGDAILLVGDPVQSNLELRAFGLTYEYSFVHSDSFELAATLGAVEMDVVSRLTVATATRHIDIQHDLAGPLPTPGLAATWVISRRFYVDARATYLKGAHHQLAGTVSDYEADVLYRLRPNISLALGYSGFRPDLSSRRPGDSGLANLDARGPQFVVRVAF